MAHITVIGEIDRHAQNPAAPGDPLSVWIGAVKATWTTYDGVGERAAAISKIATGRGTKDPKWGVYVLVLRWLGDPPTEEVSRAVYDLIADGGPEYQAISKVIETHDAAASIRARAAIVGPTANGAL